MPADRHGHAQTNSWTPNLADSTPPGSETLTAQRTKLGVVIARATVGGKPVLYTKLRSTYQHEVDSALGFADFNMPDRMQNARQFQRSASHIGYTFNWLYVDNKHDAYFNSGNDPVRPKNLDPNLPVWSKYTWKNFDPDANTASYIPFSAHPQVRDQQSIVSWNNKQARGFAGAENNLFSPVYRSQLLSDRVRSRIAGRKKMSLTGLVNAMEDAGTVDIRGDKDLPWALKVIGRPKDASLRAAVKTLKAWAASGAHRIDRDGNGTYDNSQAVLLMDAWWPRLTKAIFEPRLGASVYDDLEHAFELDNQPNNGGQHLGSAYQMGWYGYVNKDLRTILHRRVRGKYGQVYCGRGSLKRCRTALQHSLADALANADPNRIYSGDAACIADGRPHDQDCYDAVRFRPLGAVTQPLIPWINRPTYQQADEIQGHR